MQIISQISSIDFLLISTIKTEEVTTIWPEYPELVSHSKLYNRWFHKDNQKAKELTWIMVQELLQWTSPLPIPSPANQGIRYQPKN